MTPLQSVVVPPLPPLLPPLLHQDGYGQSIDRSHGACNEGKTVIVTVTDTCPCYYVSRRRM